LISALEDTFDPHAYHDEYQERVRDYVRKRAAGKTIRFPKAEPAQAGDDDLLASLEVSVTQGRRGGRAAKK
jgi:non-homologous end joining protein Ku